MKVRVACATAEDTYAVATRLAPLLRAGDVIALSGPMGCGKTLFTGGLAAALGVDGPVPSPTFVLVRHYDDGFLPLVHVDVYRLGSYNEFLDLGVLDAAAVESCAWVGYSLGGRIALAAALLRPARVERLVLESASPGLATETERRERRSADEALARTIERDGVGAWIEEWERRPLFAGRARLPDERRERFLTLRRANRPRALAAWLRGLGAGSQPSFWTRLTELAVPTLLVSGTCDHKYTGLVELMAGAIPRATHVAVEGAGHRVHLERPEPWLEAVLLFLTGEPPQR